MIFSIPERRSNTLYMLDFQAACLVVGGLGLFALAFALVPEGRHKASSGASRQWGWSTALALGGEPVPARDHPGLIELT